MSRTTRNVNVINCEKSNKGFKQLANKKLRRKNKVAINAGNFDNLINSLNVVSNVWVSNKEWKKFELN